MNRQAVRAIVLGTAISGTLDILMATFITVLRGREVPAMLRFVASGPFPSATGWGAAGSILGLLVHYALMAVMVGLFVVAASRQRLLLDRWIAAGAIYGLVTYVVLDLVIVPLRFPAAWPPSLLSVTTQLFAHIVLVGLVTAWIARRQLRPRAL